MDHKPCSRERLRDKIDLTTAKPQEILSLFILLFDLWIKVYHLA